MLCKKESYSLRELRSEETSSPEYYNTKNYEDSTTVNETIFKNDLSVKFKPFQGLFYIFLHSASMQLTAVIVKMLLYMEPCQLATIRSVSIFASVLPLNIYYTEQILGEKNNRLYLLLSGFFGCTAYYFTVTAYSYLPLAEASIVMSTLPVVTAVTARALLKEYYGLVQSFSLIVSMCGVLLAIRIPVLLRIRNSFRIDSTYVVGLAASIGAVLFLSLMCVCVRKLKDTHYSITLIYLGFIGIVENVIIVYFVPFVLPHCGWDQILCILFGAFGVLSNIFHTVALQVIPAGLCAVQKSSLDILVIIVFEIIFFGVYPDMYVICGACFVILSLFVLGIRNWVLLMPNTSKIRKNGKWLLY